MAEIRWLADRSVGASTDETWTDVWIGVAGDTLVMLEGYHEETGPGTWWEIAIAPPGHDGWTTLWCYGNWVDYDPEDEDSEFFERHMKMGQVLREACEQGLDKDAIKRAFGDFLAPYTVEAVL